MSELNMIRNIWCEKGQRFCWNPCEDAFAGLTDGKKIQLVVMQAYQPRFLIDATMTSSIMDGSRCNIIVKPVIMGGDTFLYNDDDDNTRAGLEGRAFVIDRAIADMWVSGNDSGCISQLIDTIKSMKFELDGDHWYNFGYSFKNSYDGCCGSISTKTSVGISKPETIPVRINAEHYSSIKSHNYHTEIDGTMRAFDAGVLGPFIIKYDGTAFTPIKKNKLVDECQERGLRDAYRDAREGEDE